MRFETWRRIISIAVLFIAVNAVSAIVWYGDYLWFASLGYESVFLKTLAYRIGTFTVFAAVGFIVLYSGYRWTVRNLQKTGDIAPGSWFPVLIGLIAVILGLLYADTWQVLLRYVHGVPFGSTDPIFGKNVAFYVFDLPLYQAAVGYLLLVTGLSLLSSLLVYAVYFGVDKEEIEDIVAGTVTVSSFDLFRFLGGVKQYAYTHVMVFAGFLFTVLGGMLWLLRYSLLLSQQSTVHGVGYTENLIGIPVITVAAVVSVLGGLVFLANTQFRSRKIVVLVPVLLIGVMIVGNVAGVAVQNYVVDPDEFNKEEPFIANEIQYTREAFALDRVEDEQFDVAENLTPEQLDANPGTVENVRLWDNRPLLDTYHELQLFRPYYEFTGIDDVRYNLGGETMHMLASAREIELDDLPAQSQTWVNRHLVYTHGYGVTMSPARAVTDEGFPELVVQDIPPKSSVGIDIDQPQIYYGENTDEYAIVNTRTRELDYPDRDENVYTHYAADGGVQLDSLEKQIVYAVMFRAPQIFFSGSIHDESRIQYDRQIDERAQKIAPFLTFDEDPYIVVADGELYWIYDAYTTSGNYPYSNPAQFQGEDVSYIRNSVKVTVNAYTGDTTFYVAEDDDPIINTYRGIFPELFEDLEDMPDSLQEHIRYPEDIFTVQSDRYRDYHMTDPQEFYNREDAWRIPRERLRGDTIQMEPYYLTMTLPGNDDPEFIKIQPFIPVGRENMIGWMAARSDPDHYGALKAYHFSQRELIFGPMQVESRIDQDDHISQQISLWSQSGSNVIRGNLLVIPIDDTVLYVEPLFLESQEAGTVPQLRRVIVAHGDRLTMQPSFQDALNVLFGEAEAEEPAIPDAGALPEEDIQRAQQLYSDAQAALDRGDLGEYQRLINELGQVLEGMQAAEPVNPAVPEDTEPDA